MKRNGMIVLLLAALLCMGAYTGMTSLKIDGPGGLWLLDDVPAVFGTDKAGGIVYDASGDGRLAVTHDAVALSGALNVPELLSLEKASGDVVAFDSGATQQTGYNLGGTVKFVRVRIGQTGYALPAYPHE